MPHFLSQHDLLNAFGAIIRFPFARVGVAVLLRDASGHVLLTRRAASMRTFPQAWVLPGGHAEPGERLHEVSVFLVSDFVFFRNS